MRKIAVVTDSSADISVQQALDLDVHVVRLPILVDNVEYIENETISLTEFTEKMKQGCAVKTSQPSIGSVCGLWDELLKDYEEVIYVPISSKLSGSYNSAVLAAKNYDDKVTVIDARFACAPTQFLLKEIHELIRMGKTSAEIKTFVEENMSMHAILIPEDLIYLKRGGRISSAAAALGNLLKIVPLLSVENGEIDVYDKVRTARKAHKMALDFTLDVDNLDDYYFLVLYGGEENEASKEMYRQLCEKVNPDDTYYGPIYPVILAHAGPGTVGIGYVKKLKAILR
ncbi:MAG: DegV family protein [Erysipelotrichaceae bacterium]|nr:DegV family protein [Erysipelotrichaceae bacterium]